MRNPIRLKNLSARYLPFYLVGIGLLVWFPPRPSGFLAAGPVFVLGLGLRTWGAGHLVKNDVLTTTGPYAHLRHPLYAGTILIATGFAILFGGILGALLIASIWPWFAFVYFPRKERIESTRLETLYGDRYAGYRRAVPALWPRWQAFPFAPADGAAASISDPVAAVNPPMQSVSARPHWAFERYSENNELGTLLAVMGALAVIALRALSVNA